MKKTSTTKFRNLPLFGLAIVFILPALLMAGCGGDNSKAKTAATPIDSSKASFKIIGVWVNLDDSSNKNVFTADSVSDISLGYPTETIKYNWVNEQEIELINSKTGAKQKRKVAIDGDFLSITFNDQSLKYIREGAIGNTAMPAGNDPMNTSLTPAQILFKDKLTGTWESHSNRYVFTKDGRSLLYFPYDTVNISYSNIYRIVGDSMIDWTHNRLTKNLCKVLFSDNNRKMTLVFTNGQMELTYVSENDEVDFSAYLKNNIVGYWVGIAGTGSADDTINIFSTACYIKHKNNINESTIQRFKDSTIFVNGAKASIENDILALTDNKGGVKKYNRLKGVWD